MYRLRRATFSDLPILYRLQNIPERERLLQAPLPPYSRFAARARKKMKSKQEYYFILEADETPAGLIWISVPGETCEIWGRHLRTLFYACAWAAFEQLGMTRLKWCVRKSNRRMIQVCRQFQIRKTGEDFFLRVSGKLAFIAAGEIYYYELTPSEYGDRIPIMEKGSMPRSVFESECAVSA